MCYKEVRLYVQNQPVLKSNKYNQAQMGGMISYVSEK